MALPPGPMRAPPSGLQLFFQGSTVTPQAPTQAPRRCSSSLFRGPSLTTLSLLLTKAGLMVV